MFNSQYLKKYYIDIKKLSGDVANTVSRNTYAKLQNNMCIVDFRNSAKKKKLNKGR